MTPEPARSAPRQGERAGIVTRTAAAVADAGVVAAMCAALYGGAVAVVFAWSPTSFSWPAPPWGALLAVSMLVAFCYLTAGWALVGRTVGAALLGLRVLSRSGGHPRWGTAAVRAALCVVVPLGLAWVAVSPQRRSLADVVLRTRVVYDWSRRPPTSTTAVSRTGSEPSARRTPPG